MEMRERAKDELEHIENGNLYQNMLRQVYFDDKDSLSYKVALAKSRGLLGVGVWALGYEGGYYDIWDIFAKR